MRTHLDLPTLFLKSFALFKHNFQQFMIFGIASALIGSLVQFFPEGNEVLGIVKSFCMLIFGLIQIWITISLILLINSKLLGEELSASEAFHEGRSLYGNYFLTNILLGFRILLVGIPLILLFSLGQNTAVYIVGGIIGIVGLAYMLIHYSYAPIMRLLNPEVNTPFATSYSLAKPYRMEIFIIFLMLGVLTVVSQLAVLSKAVTYPLSVIIEIVSSSFVIPFTTIVSVILYHFLVDQHHAETISEEELNNDND